MDTLPKKAVVGNDAFFFDTVGVDTRPVRTGSVLQASVNGAPIVHRLFPSMITIIAIGTVLQAPVSRAIFHCFPISAFLHNSTVTFMGESRAPYSQTPRLSIRFRLDCGRCLIR